MKKYKFPLNHKQQCELVTYFSPRNNGQFNYFNFMEYFLQQSLLENNSFRSKYILQSKVTSYFFKYINKIILFI